jgi:hypothetical protein
VHVLGSQLHFRGQIDQRAGHAQPHDKAGLRRCIPQEGELLTVALQAGDVLPDQEGRGSARAHDDLRLIDPHAADELAEHMRLQAQADGFDLGKFRHPGSI